MTRFERPFVWGGGAMFVLSLAACAYSYVVVWAAARPAGRIGPAGAIAANVLFFSLFALHHSVCAREPVKDRIARLIPPRVIRSAYVWMASALLILVLVSWQPVGGTIYAVAGWGAVGLALLQLSGVVLIARSVSRIDALELAGIRPASQRHALQIAGPYRFVRHPLYLGWILVVFGAAHLTADRFVFAAISTAYLLVAIPWEEQSLRRTFGASYADYQREVRWRVVPFLY